MRTVDNIVGAVEQLEDQPRSGRMVPEFGRIDLREIIVGLYRVIYVINGETVTDLRVVHGARDLIRIDLEP